MTVPNQCDLAKVKVSRALPPPEAPGENLGLSSPTLPPSPLQCSPELFCLYPSLAWSLGGHIFVGDSFSFQSSKLSFSLLVNIVILFSLPAPLPSLPLLFRPLSFSLLNPPPPPPASQTHTTSHHGQITLRPSEVQQAQSKIGRTHLHYRGTGHE